MYKLLIADDEPLERQAIRYFIDDSHLEIGEILESENGTATVKTAMEKQPDIIILDIKMPGLTGLEAMERIIAVNKKCKVIFSTAYNYFDYAVKALKLNAMDFLVKPVKKELLISVINKAIDELDTEKSTEQKELKLDDVIQILGNKILGELLIGRIDEETLYYLDAIGVDSNTGGQVFAVKMSNELNSNKMQKLQSILRKDLYDAGYQSITKINDRNLSLIVFSPEPSLRKKITPVTELILSSIFRDLGMSYNCSCGIEFEDISEIEQSFSDAYGCIIKSPGIEHAWAPQKGRNKGFSSDKQSIPPEIKFICNYISRHYKEKITLDKIAEEVKYSKYHISRLFKQYMNITIVDYLIRLRIKKAKELLLDGSYSIKQISHMVGYSDPNYFTWAFKKQEGVSPAKFRYS
ncbi:MAG: response regulator, partial [Tissierellia bacterium]|nr:response regulator [Tissierellia bacterium]